MISFSLTPFTSSALSFDPLLVLKTKSLRTSSIFQRLTQKSKRRIRTGACRAELYHDAPLTVAIGACIFSSLFFPPPPGPDDDEEGDLAIDSADARFAVMGIISFIPYFNWMSWVFAWMDTGNKRYLAYAVVYLAPYLRSNLSLSPEESWLPVASILLCIVHIQLEASIKNGDFQSFQIFNEASRQFSQEKDRRISKEEISEDGKHFPSARGKSRTAIRGWGVPTKPSQQPEHLNKDGETEEH